MKKYEIDGLEIYSNYKPKKDNFAKAMFTFIGAVVIIDFIIQAYLSALINTY